MLSLWSHTAILQRVIDRGKGNIKRGACICRREFISEAGVFGEHSSGLKSLLQFTPMLRRSRTGQGRCRASAGEPLLAEHHAAEGRLHVFVGGNLFPKQGGFGEHSSGLKSLLPGLYSVMQNWRINCCSSSTVGLMRSSARYSSGWWAWAISPGPRMMVSMPRLLR